MGQNALPKYGRERQTFVFWPMAWANINIFNKITFI
jgi:hypothetical protein